MKQRRDRLLRFAGEMGCNAVATLEPENLFYMTGFWGEAVGLLEDGGRTTIVAPALEAERARAESVDCDVVESGRGAEMMSYLTSRIKSGRVCVDCQNYHTMQSIKRSAPGVEPSSEPFHSARVVKDSAEIATLKKASGIIDEMFELCTQKIGRGQKESELQANLMSYAVSRQMFDTGYRSTLNPLIIAGGPNGALPHAQVTERRFAEGDLIVVDLTLRYRGYVSDATRTFALGKISDDAARAYDAVRESQRLGLEAARPGARCSEVDGACRDHISGAGYGKYFIHSTGHGIGLDVHERPTISGGSAAELAEGMAVTVEPGVYIPGRFGIRIEDSIIVGERQAVMHGFTKELVVL